MTQKKQIRNVAYAALIAALYVVLTMIANLLGLASQVIQVRFSEALTILPYFTPAAIPGLTVGCVIAGFLTGALPADIIFGSAATLIGAVFTYLLRNKHSALAPVPPIVSNTLIVPFILKFGYGFTDAIPFMMLTVGAGEIISCGILGTALLIAVKKRKIFA